MLEPAPHLHDACDPVGPCDADGGPGPEIVRVSCIRHVYADQTAVDLCGLDLVVHERERVVILGANGSGKTTLLFHLVGLLRLQEGFISVFGRDPSRQYAAVRERIGVVLQNVDDQILNPTVYDDVAFAPRNYGYPPALVDEMVGKILEELKITHLARKVPHHLSGGEKRKVALAGALVLRPQLLILDEPFTGLDPQSRHELVLLLNHFNRDHRMAVIVSTHEIDLVAELADQVYLLARRGGILHKGTPRQVLSQLDLLRENKLEAPLLTELFARLRAAGYALPQPLTIDEAVAALLDHKIL